MGMGGGGRNGDPETHMWIAVLPLELEPKLHRCSAGWVHMEPLGLEAMEMLLISEMTCSVIAEVAPFLYLSRSYSGRPEIHSLAVILLYIQTDKGSGKSKSAATLHSFQLQCDQEESKKWEHVPYSQHMCFSAPRYTDKSPVKRMEWTWT